MLIPYRTSEAKTPARVDPKPVLRFMVEDVHSLVAMLKGGVKNEWRKGSGDPMVPTLRNFVVPALVF